MAAETFLPDLPNASDSRILIVDDEEAVRKVIVSCLQQNYACVTAANAQEALDCLANEQFALALLDVQMPGLNGIELLRKIAGDFPDVAVIMVSGVDRSQRILDALRLGAYDYLIKPFDVDVLLLTVERVLARRALLRDARRYKHDLERRNTELAAQKAELERLQAQLVQNEKMASIGQLAAGVAHELNNPAAFIYSNMESLARYVSNLSRLLSAHDQLPPSPERALHIDALKREIHYDVLLSELPGIVTDCQEGASRIRDIVQNLRTFSRLDEAELKKVDIHAGIDATIRLLSQYYNSNHISLKRDYANLPPVECFASQLNQVWMNLLINAAQAVGSGPGEVRIATRLDGGMVSVTISDTGSGIAPDHLEKIFDPFFSTKPVGQGTGLGLSISYGIVANHGGVIKVASVPDRGTTFTTLIPLKPTLSKAKQGN